jgi:peptidoglycan hydrolase-like protein with peptidoglycan-binding domain
VRFLQECLVTAGRFAPSDVSSQFDEMTELAVLDFQQMNGLDDDGIVGRKTWRTLLPFAGHVAGDEERGERLKPELKRGSSGGYVHYLQEMLSGQLEPAIGIDGKFGPETEAALRAFQELNGLHVDGIAGEDTWKWLEHLHTTANPPKRWEPPARPAPRAAEPDLPPPTADQIEQGGQLVWPLLVRAHEQAKWFAQFEGAMEEYKFEAGDAAVGAGIGAITEGPAGALMSLAESLGLGFLKEQAYLATYDDVIETKSHYYLAFQHGFEDALEGRPFGNRSTNPLLGGLARMTYDDVSKFNAEQRRWISAWIESHNGLREALSMAE